MTESSYNNSLSVLHIWLTVKTLPATLPEPRSVVRGSSFADHRPAAPNKAPGLLILFAGPNRLSNGGDRFAWWDARVTQVCMVKIALLCDLYKLDQQCTYFFKEITIPYRQ